MQHLEVVPLELIAGLSTQLRRDLLLNLPVADVCSLLQEPIIADGIDTTEVWEELYSTRLPKISESYVHCGTFTKKIDLYDDIPKDPIVMWELCFASCDGPPVYSYFGGVPELNRTMHGYYSAIASMVVSHFQLLQDNPSESEGKRIAYLLCSVPLSNFAVLPQTEDDPIPNPYLPPCEEVVQWVVPPRYSFNISDPPRTGCEILTLLVDCFKTLPAYLCVFMFDGCPGRRSGYYFSDTTTNQVDENLMKFVDNVQCLELLNVLHDESISANVEFSPLLPLLKCHNQLMDVTLKCGTFAYESRVWGIPLTQLIPALCEVVSRPQFHSLTLDSSRTSASGHPNAGCLKIKISELKRLLEAFYASPSPNCNGTQELSFISVLIMQDSDGPGVVSLMREFGAEDITISHPKSVHFRDCHFTINMTVHAK